MNEEEKIIISVNQEDMQNLINCYKKDIEYIMQLEKQNQKYKEVINKAIEYIKYCQTSDDDIFPVIEAEKMIEILKEVE